MKKVLSVLMLVCLVISSMIGFSSAETATSSVFEEFALHSGVLFGMTMEEVQRIEEEKGFTVTKTTDYGTFYNEKGEYKGRKYDVLRLYGQMAGISGSQLLYYFNDDNQLFTAIYTFGDHDLASYNTIQDLINNKYTNRTLYSDDEHGYSCPQVLDYLLQDLTIYSNLSKLSSGTIGLDEEIYHCANFTFMPLGDDYRVYISHAMAHPNVSGYSDEMNQLFGGKHFLEYDIISLSELQDIKDRIEGKTQRDQEEQENAEREAERQRENDI